MKKIQFVGALLIMVYSTAYCQEQWMPIVEGVLDGKPADLFLKSVQHGFPCFVDMDGDGDSDLVLGGYVGIRYYRNDGTNVHPKWTLVNSNLLQMPFNMSYHQLDPAAVDLDSDGDLDFIVGSSQGYLYRYRRDGEQDYAKLSNQLVPGISGDNMNVGVGDLTGDRVPDLVLGIRTGTTGKMYYCEGVLSGTEVQFPTAQILDLDIEGQCFPIPELCDLDGDADLDLIISTASWPDYASKIFYYRNDGSKSAYSYTKVTNNYFPLPGDCWARISFFDFENDNDQDCIIFDASLGYFGFMKNEGSASIAQWKLTRDCFQMFSYQGLSEIAAFGDLDGDGDQDMLQAGSIQPWVWVIGFYENIGTPACANWKFKTRDYVDTVNKGRFPALCDIDQDGDLDLFLGCHISYGNPGIIFYRNDGDAKNPAWTYITDTWMGITAPEKAIPCFGDLNGDGLPDLLLGYKHASSAPKVRYYANSGSIANPVFASYTDLVEPIYPGPIIWSLCHPALGDVDSDGDLDLFVATDSNPTDLAEQRGQINFFRNIGSATDPAYQLEEAQWLGLSVEQVPSIATGDPDGDGLPNLFISDRDMSLQQFACKGALLSVTPAVYTLPVSTTLEFQVAGNIGSVSAIIEENRSGSSIIGSIYTAGSTAGVIDKIRFQDTSGRLFRNTYVNVISATEMTRAGKAVIVAGWKGTGDPLWPDTARSTTNYLANFAYRTLLHRGFSKENVYYLSPDPAQDVDGDGANNDVDAESTLLNVQYTLSDWAGQAPAPAKLLVYLVDHGGEQGTGQGYLRLNPGEVLLAQSVDSWLDALQAAHPDLEVTLAVDACRSGSFLDECLAPTGLSRVTLASAMDSQDAFFSAGGAISFSEAFFNSVYTGLSVGQSFSNASGAMDRYQTAWLDDTGDGVWGKDDDGAAADARVIGATFIAGADRPQIGKINANQSIASGTSALLWASDVASVYPIDEVFAVIMPPSFQPNPDHNPEQPVTELPRLELTWNPLASRYEGTYNEFTETGAYKVVLYARDIWDSLSYPKQTYVNQLGSTEKVVIVAGDTAFNAYSPWEYSNALANYAYRTCLDRWIGKERIRYFSGQSSQDVDGNGAADDVYASPGLAGLSDTMTAWASDALRLTVYLVGEMGEDRFQLNGAEALYSDQLASWLNTLASGGVQRITVVLEGDASGSFVDDLEGAGRNVIASCSSGGTALNQIGGMLSFSQFFWNQVLNGINVRDSFQFGRQAMRFLTAYAQQAAIQDGAGGALAVQTWIGAAFVTGEEAPTIGAVSEDVFYATGEAMLWASQVSDPDGIERVWALVVPPDYDPALDLIDEVTLAYNASQARYEAALGGLAEIGQYRLTFFAEDREGNLSAPKQTTLLYGMDAYEEDDTIEKAALLYVNQAAQYHNFHDAGDADWVKFYLFAGRRYSLEANNLEERCDVTLNFRDGLGQLITQGKDWSGNVAEAIPVDATVTGAYYLEVIHADGQIFGASTGYEIEVFDTGGSHNGLATSIGGRSAMCSWDAAPGARGYHLYRSLGDPNGPFVQVNASEIAATSYLDEGLEPETLYFYYVNKVEMDGTETDWTGTFYVLTGPEKPSPVVRWELY
jgi:hypothetical protein